MYCNSVHDLSFVTESMAFSSPYAVYSVSVNSAAPCCSKVCVRERCTCVNKYSHKLSASHDELWHHVNIVISAGPQLGGRFLTWPEALIQLQTRV